jgi:hypothetical protein
MASKKEIVDSDAIPKPFPVMPFSAAVKYGGMVYLSGNIGMDPKTNKLVEGPIQERTVTSTHVLAKSNVDALLMLRVEANHEDYHECVERFWVRLCKHHQVQRVFEGYEGLCGYERGVLGVLS